jgi:ADP-ribosylglycohydrolase
MQLNIHVIEDRLREEIQVRQLTGQVVDGMAEKLDAARGDRQACLSIHDQLKNLPIRSNWPYHEPSDLACIRDNRPEAANLPTLYLSEIEIENKILGGWLGRIVGCILGKPLEVDWSQEDIADYLAKANALPLSDFIPPQSRNGKVLRRDSAPSMRGLVHFAQEDDDLNYMCLTVKLLEKIGFDFHTLDVGINWLESIPFMWTWGPEHVVYLNLATAIGEHTPMDVDLEDIAGTFNPGFEYIGAQIRTDVYGYVCPGNPEKAAELAWRDACLTHRKSGIYGAMWIAAMNASAFLLLDPEQIILSGLAQVPRKSRFSEAILRVIEWCQTDPDWQTTGRRIRNTYNEYGPAGTINNAACVAAALLHGWRAGMHSPAEQYEQVITIAAQMGYDTDCNGASAGSVAGVILGASMLPEKWIHSIHDDLHTCVAEFGKVSIRQMASRTYQLSRIYRSFRNSMVNIRNG